MLDVVGEDLLSHVVVYTNPVVKEVCRAHNRGHESWILNISEIFHQLSLTLSRELALYPQ